MNEVDTSAYFFCPQSRISDLNAFWLFRLGWYPLLLSCYCFSALSYSLVPFLWRNRFLCLNLFCFTHCSLFPFSLEIILATTLWAVMYASSFYRPHTPSSLTESSHRFRLIQMQTTEVFDCHPLPLKLNNWCHSNFRYTYIIKIITIVLFPNFASQSDLTSEEK